MLTSLAAATQYRDKPALIADGRTFSFRELDILSNAFAVKLSVAAGGHVTLYAVNSWEWLVSYHGVQKPARLSIQPG